MRPAELECVGLMKRFSLGNRLVTEILTKTIFFSSGCPSAWLLMCWCIPPDIWTTALTAPPCLFLCDGLWSRPFNLIWPMLSCYRHKFDSVNKAAGQNLHSLLPLQPGSKLFPLCHLLVIELRCQVLAWRPKPRMLQGISILLLLDSTFVQFCIIRHLIKVPLEKITHKHVYKCCYYDSSTNP